MPRAGLTPAAVVAAGADLADEVGWNDMTLAQVADRVGVRPPSLYKHITGQDDLNRRIAALALNEVADAIGDAIQGLAGRDALAAAAGAMRGFVTAHPGRYAATIGIRHSSTGAQDDHDVQDPIAVAEARGLASFAAVLRGYDVPPAAMPHALRTVRSIFHGFATLEAAGGFQYATDKDDSFAWLVAMVDHGLRGMTAPEPGAPGT